jgi:hypothetical protein
MLERFLVYERRNTGGAACDAACPVPVTTADSRDEIIKRGRT